MLRNFCVLIIVLISGQLKAKPIIVKDLLTNNSWKSIVDTSGNQVSSEALKKFANLRINLNGNDTINIKQAQLQTFTNIASIVQAQVAGVYVQKPSGEPGVFQNIIIRGVNSPVFDNTALNSVRPTVFVNGVPMTTNHNFAYGVQSYKYSRIGPETDFLNFVDVSAIESIEVVKDPLQLAALGPLASNGAILITTFGGKSGIREISLNSYFGINTKPSVSPVNAQYENLFRQPFYSLYNNSLAARQLYPGFLTDSTNLNYYGASRWQDEYYSNAAMYSVDLSLRGGSDRANFGFLGGHTKNASTADKTALDRYNALLNINMLPFSWFRVSAFINATRTERNRNKNLRDRYAEMGYLPDLSTPLSPNLELYKTYLNEYNRVVDDNFTNSVQGSLSLSFDILSNLNYTTSLLIDYSDGIHDVFYPSELMQTINYVSNYYGYSQRYSLTNRVGYELEVDDKNRLSFNVGVDYLDDLYRYGYARAYDGPNDFIKLNVVNGDPNKANYLEPLGGLNVYRWYNTERNRLFSIYGKVGYNFKSILDINALLRWDGSSSVQPDHRWLFTPSASAKWNIDKQFELDEVLSLKIGAGRVGKIQMDSKFAVGPQYSTNLNWSTESIIGSFYGNSALSRPYSTGWIGYDMGWNYVDQFDLTVQKSFLDKKISAYLSLYQKENKNQIVLIPVPEEYGYVGQYKNGLNVRNQGIDLSISADIIDRKDGFKWNSALNLNHNINKVTALPDNLSQLVVGNRLLQVGKPVDAFWVYENVGIYMSNAEVPVQNNTAFNYDGISFAYGDPKWVDQNNDFRINESDKVLKGSTSPKVFGGFFNKFTYKNFDVSIDLAFALGNKALNERASTKYNFINNESNNSIGSTREIFHWQQDVDIAKYPLYNVWSSIDAYRVDQDLFLENASYMKVRGITLGYSLTKASFLSKIRTLRRAYVYATVNNAFTISNFSGGDPELVNINGYYDGYGLPLTPTFSLGFKLDI